MEPVIQQSLPFSVQAANFIRNGIIGGRYKLGQRLNEVELSTSIGISRSPIREALRTLEEEGLVKLTTGRGAFVVSLTTSEVRELLEVRSALELLAVQLAAERATDEDLAHLEASIEKLTALHRESDGWDQPWSCDFHLDIFTAARNQKLREQGWGIHRQLRLTRFRSGASSDRTEEAREEHMAILEALRSHNAQEAGGHMQVHLARASEHILRLLEESEKADSLQAHRSQRLT